MVKTKTSLKKKALHIEVPFYRYLSLFIDQERAKIYSKFTPLSRKFLKFNDSRDSNAFLRAPQFEALEVYVFLKEFCHNKHLHEIFENWFYKKEEFEGRTEGGVSRTGQLGLFTPIEANNEADKQVFKEIFEQLKKSQQIYPNYIYALTMGLGKTVLMATCIFYEFLLANKYPKDSRFAHNALVFAPDKTVLQSLKEIQTFDKSKVVPPEYVNWLETNLKFYFLDDTGNALNSIDKSKYNIIISNTQKIILKKQRTEKSSTQAVFNSDYDTSYKAKSIYKSLEEEFEGIVESDLDLLSNQRFTKLLKLEQLGIYVDEAHHVFGTKLIDELISAEKSTSLRLTINELAAHLKEAGTQVVGCYNYTGTPYVKNRLLPEVVYTYSLRDAIDNKYLKQVQISSFKNIKKETLSFIRLVINEFTEKFKGKTFEGMLPKIAFFASNIEELEKELKPAVEKVLSELNISTERILVNVGDEKLTSNDSLREFKNLDTVDSKKQFILLVNKGKEGWNCRSLFGVALHRQPKSKIFVLQATMRCLRQISNIQETGYVYLSDENLDILNSELEENFRLTVDELNKIKDEKETVEVHLVPPPVKIKLKRIKKLHQLKEKKLVENIDLQIDCQELNEFVQKYKITRENQKLLDNRKSEKIDYTFIKEQRKYSSLTLVFEIARYLNKSPLLLKRVLETTVQGINLILEKVNEYNELIYDWIIPRLFREFYEIEEYEKKEEEEIELIKEPKDGFYKVKVKKDNLACLYDDKYSSFKDKSFHLDNYCFDSKPENEFFWRMLNNEKIEKIWFTGMFKQEQSNFVINYIDPESNTVRNYYPDFLLYLKDKTYLIIEVKGDHQMDDAIVKAKEEYADKIASVNRMKYKLVKSSEVLTSVI